MTRNAQQTDLGVAAKLPACSDAVVSTEVDGDFVVVDTETHEAHALEGDVATVWRAVQTGTVPDLPRERTQEILDALAARGLLAPEEDGLSRRSVLKAGAAAFALTGLTSIALPAGALAATSHQITTDNTTITLRAGQTTTFTLVGGGGGGGSQYPGGAGGSVTGTIQNPMANGDLTLTIRIGGGGGDSNVVSPVGGSGGFAAGGAGGGGGGGGGGAASAIELSGTPLVVAGGGGGGGFLSAGGTPSGAGTALTPGSEAGTAGATSKTNCGGGGGGSGALNTGAGSSNYNGGEAGGNYVDPSPPDSLAIVLGGTALGTAGAGGASVASTVTGSPGGAGEAFFQGGVS